MKRWALRIVLLLIAGFFLSVSSSFVCSYLRFGTVWRSEPIPRNWKIHRETAKERWHEQFPDDDREHAGYMYQDKVGLGHSSRGLVAGKYVGFGTFPADAFNNPPDTYVQFRAGLPVSAFEGEITDYRGIYSERNLIPIGSRYIPVRPLPIGLLVNSIAHAVIILLVLSMLVPFWKGRLRKRRIRKGLCPMCSYELASNLDAGCPECGWGR